MRTEAGKSDQANPLRPHIRVNNKLCPMMMNELVVDRAVFAILAEECERIIDTRKRLPEFVFKRSFTKYVAVEYAQVYRGGACGLSFRHF